MQREQNESVIESSKWIVYVK